MSLATRCTHCGTIFKVVQDQLKVSEGWVRCGRCDQIFNALPTLFDLETEAPPPRPTPPAPPSPPPPPPQPTPAAADSQPHSEWASTETEAHSMSPPAEPEAAVPSMARPDFDLDTDVPLSQPPADTAPAPVTPPQEWLDNPPSDLPATDEADALDSRYLMPSERPRKMVRRPARGPEFADAEFPTDALEDEWAADLANESGEAPAADASAVEAEAEAGPSSRLPETATKPARKSGSARTKRSKPATPDFVKQADRQAFWRHPFTRAVLSVFAVLLLTALALQAVHQFRDLIAAHQPGLRPMLQNWCHVVGCKLAPPRQLESLQVESAALVSATSEGLDRYKLTVVVGNRAAIDLQWPHVDVTLTDRNGAVIGRRILRAEDAEVTEGSATRPVPATVPAETSTTLQWRLRLSDLTPAGYTAELFYP